MPAAMLAMKMAIVQEMRCDVRFFNVVLCGKGDTGCSPDDGKGVAKVLCRDDAIAGETDCSDRLRTLEIMLEVFANGISLKEINGIPSEQMDDLYDLAHELYYEGRLDEAERLFRFLCIYDFFNADFLTGLAAVYQLKCRYGKAIDIYALAFAQADGNYHPVLYAGQCHLALGHRGTARKCFSAVASHSSDAALLAKAREYLGKDNKELADHVED